MLIDQQFGFDETSVLALSSSGRWQLGRHERNAGMTAGLVAKSLGLDGDHCRQIERATALHDVGKLCLPPYILEKAGPLNAEEGAMMRLHPLAGYIRLKSLPGSQLLDLASEIALAHHERWDGKGYPFGKAGAEILLPARIAAICDVYSALRETRPYKASLGHEAAMQIITERCAGQFDPMVVSALENCEQHVRQVMDKRTAEMR